MAVEHACWRFDNRRKAGGRVPSRCTVAERRAAGSSRGALRRFETTLLELVSEFSDTLQDDERAVRLVAQLIRAGWVRTSEGLEAQLSLG